MYDERQMTRPDDATELIRCGHAAAAARDWNAALDAFRRAVELRPDGETYEGLAAATWWLNDFDASIAAREQAYRLYRAAGDARSASRAAVWLASDYGDLHGQPAVANGWLQRAYRVLGEDHDCAEYGWARAIEAHAAMMYRHEAERGHACAAEAIALGRAHGDVDLEATATAYDGLARIMVGEIDAGIAMLDEAATVALFRRDARGRLGGHDSLLPHGRLRPHP